MQPLLLRCDCDLPSNPAIAFQDRRYGKGIRLHTPCKGKDGQPQARCTICLKEKPLPK
jgi:hypothetical protein